ncbi:alginate export family protein [Thiolapillus sp.]
MSNPLISTARGALLLALMPLPVLAQDAQQSAAGSSQTIISNPDDYRPDDQFTIPVFGRDLIIGGEYEIRAEQRGNYALSDTDNDREKYRQKLELEFRYDISSQVKALLETKLISSADHRADQRSHLDTLERGESWLDISRPLGGKSTLGLRIGRQNFAEEREWWWDEDLDAVRLYYASPRLSLELGLAEELGGKATNQPLPEDKRDIQRVLAHLSWEYSKGHKLELFGLYHDDRSSTPEAGDQLAADKEDESDARLVWYGIRVRGKDKIKDLGKIRYWVDLGAVKGKEDLLDFDDISTGRIEVTDAIQRDVKGNAIDIGLTLKSKLPGQPSFTLGFAQGSGDSNPADNTDRAFRQTGLDDNNGKFNGVDSFRYYGELLRPQLSNIRISTASLGYPLLRDSSIEILYHRYHQVEASDQLSSRLRISPDGRNTFLGDEIDIVLGLEEWKKLELELVGSVFRAGDAFGDREGDLSYFINLKLNYNF